MYSLTYSIQNLRDDKSFFYSELVASAYFYLKRSVIIFDIFTTNKSIFSLIFLAASVSHMLPGSMMIVVCILSILYLKKKYIFYHFGLAWLGNRRIRNCRSCHKSLNQKPIRYYHYYRIWHYPIPFLTNIRGDTSRDRGKLLQELLFPYDGVRFLWRVIRNHFLCNFAANTSIHSMQTHSDGRGIS